MNASNPSIAEGERPYSRVIDRLRAAGLRPTRQRLGLGRLLFAGGDHHVTAEMLHAEAVEAGLRVSLATVYNTLHQFTEAGLLREVTVDSKRSYFDTNTSDHHHYLFESSGRLEDIPTDQITVVGLPTPPEGTRLARVHVVVRLDDK